MKTDRFYVESWGGTSYGVVRFCGKKIYCCHYQKLNDNILKDGYTEIDLQPDETEDTVREEAEFCTHIETEAEAHILLLIGLTNE